MLSVLIADDRPTYAEALAFRLSDGSTSCAAASTGVQAVAAAVERGRPQVVVLDLDHTGQDAVALIATLCARGQPVHAVVLSHGHDAGLLTAAVRAGARAIVLKHEPTDRLARVVHGVMEAEMHIPPHTLTAVVANLLHGPTPSRSDQLVGRLTRREQDVLQLMVAGQRRAEIAASMFVSINTVRTHTRNILAKLEVHSSVEAVSVARRAGVCQPTPIRAG